MATRDQPPCRIDHDHEMCVRAYLDGTKELGAIQDGYRESTQCWDDLLRDLKRRGMRTLVVAVGEGALGVLGGAAGSVARDP